jgi:hypothetical protein
VNARLGRELDAPSRERAIRLFDEIELILKRREELRDLIPSKEKEVAAQPLTLTD